jgi:hypothetical protein
MPQLHAVADTIIQILNEIYQPILVPKMAMTHRGDRGDITEDSISFEIRNPCGSNWCHLRNEPTSVRLGKFTIFVDRVFFPMGCLSWSGNLEISLTDPDSIPTIFRLFHLLVTDQLELLLTRMEGIDHKGTYDYRIARCQQAVRLLDLRYIIQRSKNEYLGQVEIADVVTIGPPNGELRPYQKREILNEMHDPCRWEGNETRTPDNSSQ